MQPVVFDEPYSGRLVCDAVVHKVDLGPWGNQEERQARTVATASLDASQSLRGRPAASIGQDILRGSRLADDRTHDMVIPTVRIVPHDKDCCASPFRTLLQIVERVHKEQLFIQWGDYSTHTISSCCRLSFSNWSTTSSEGLDSGAASEKGRNSSCIIQPRRKATLN